jgi:hypothetical protein
VSNAVLKVYPEQDRGELEVTVSGNAESIVENFDPDEHIRSDAVAGQPEARNDTILIIPFEDFVYEQKLDDGVGVVYSHSPIAVTSDELDIGSGVPVEVQYKGVSVNNQYEGDGFEGNSESIQWEPTYRFVLPKESESEESGGSESGDLSIQELFKQGIDERYNRNRSSRYEPYNNSTDEDREFTGNARDWSTPYQMAKDDIRYGFTDGERFRYNPCEGGSTIQACTALSDPIESPWDFYDDVDTANQVPGTALVSSSEVLQLYTEAAYRYQVSLLLNHVMNRNKVSQGEVLEESRTFLKSLGSTLKTALGVSKGVDIIKTGLKSAQLANNTEAFLNTSLQYFDTEIGPLRFFSGWLSFDHVTQLVDIEFNETLLETQLSAAGPKLTYATAQYQNVLVQQLVLGMSMRTILETAANPSQPVENFGELTDEQRDSLRFLAILVKDYNQSLQRSLGSVSNLRGSIVEDEGVTIETDELGSSEVFKGDTSTIQVTVRNDGDDSVTRTVYVTANGETVAETEPIEVDSNWEQTVEVDMEFPGVGEYNVRVNDEPLQTITVKSPFNFSNLSIERDTVEVTEPVPVGATVENISETDRKFTLDLDPGTGSTTVTASGGTIPAGESVDSVAYFQYDTTGEYTVSTANGRELGTVTVTEYELPADQDFPMRGYTAENSMVNPDATGFTSPSDTKTAPVRWEYDISDDEYLPLGPVVVDEKAILPTKTGLIAVHPGTGEKLWSADTGEAATMTPAYMDGSLYVSDYGGTVYAVNPENGEVTAQNRMNEHVRSLAASDGEVFGYNEHQDFTYTQETVVKFDADLSIQWTIEAVEGFHDGPPAVGDDLVIVGDGRTTAAYDRGDGSLVWESERTYSNNPVSIHDGEVYVSGWSGYLSGPTLGVYDLASGEQLRGTDEGASLYTTPHVSDGVVYVGGDGGVHSWDAETMSKQGVYSMSESESSGGLFSSSSDSASVGDPFVVTNSQVIAVDSAGVVRAFDKRSRTIQWEYVADNGGVTAIAAGGQVFVTTENKHIALG